MGLNAAAAFAVFWPRHLGGIADDDDAALCFSAAHDCAQVLACAGYSAAGCTATERCDGDTMVSCRTLGRGISAELHVNCAADPAGNNSCRVAEDSKNGVGPSATGPAVRPRTAMEWLP